MMLCGKALFIFLSHQLDKGCVQYVLTLLFTVTVKTYIISNLPSNISFNLCYEERAP